MLPPKGGVTLASVLPYYTTAKMIPGQSPGRCGSVGQASSHKLKGPGFDSQSGRMPGLQVQSPVRAHAVPGWKCTMGNQSMFLSHIDVSLPVLFPSLLSINNEKMSSGEDEA